MPVTTVDLHLHTTFSDGMQTPAQLVAEAAARGLTLIAVTDHDDIDGIVPAQEAGCSLGVEVIAGVEINTDLGAEEVHLLGYGFPLDAPALREGLAALRLARVARLQRMIARLETLGKPVLLTRVLELAGAGSVGRPHLAQALVEAGYVASTHEAFDRLIGNRARAYVPRQSFPPEQAVALIRQSGGVASLAHPGKLGDPMRIIKRLLPHGLDALEAYHPDHTPAVTERMLQRAAQFRLGVTGGSDSHGVGVLHGTAPGAVAIPESVREAFCALLQRRAAGE